MPELSPSTDFLNDVAAAVRAALADLDRHEADLVDLPTVPEQREHTWSETLGRLEGNLAGWQAILGDMAERVRTTQDDLATLDADLKQSLDAFAAARKYLQGEAASGSGA